MCVRSRNCNEKGIQWVQVGQVCQLMMDMLFCDVLILKTETTEDVLKQSQRENNPTSGPHSATMQLPLPQA